MVISLADYTILQKIHTHGELVMHTLTDTYCHTNKNVLPCDVFRQQSYLLGLVEAACFIATRQRRNMLMTYYPPAQTPRTWIILDMISI
jgi:hypothetical protein